jgi:hypothetical protein
MTIPPDLEAQILRYHLVEKWRVGTIARQLRVHHETVVRVLSQAGLPKHGSPARRSQIEPYLPFIRATLEKFPELTASRLFVMVRERGYRGGPDYFRHLVARHRPRRPAEAYLRLRSLPGEQAQVDWGHFGHLTIGRARRPLLAFVMVLSWSGPCCTGHHISEPPALGVTNYHRSCHWKARPSCASRTWRRVHCPWCGVEDCVRCMARYHTAMATAALRRETPTIPIVFVNVADPVAGGIVTRLDRPSGNITGFAGFEASAGGKWLELLSEIAPGLNRAAIMFNPDLVTASAFMPSLETAARSLKVVPITAPVHDDVEIETAIIALRRGAPTR